MMTLRFSTPTIVATPGALSLMGAHGIAGTDLIRRHFAGEWNGQPDNAIRNEEYLASGEGMLLSVFPAGDETIWVISHVGYGEDSYTVLLMPEEY
jgi:hypothetical protein